MSLREVKGDARAAACNSLRRSRLRCILLPGDDKIAGAGGILELHVRLYNEHDDPIPPALDHRHGARTTQQPSDHAAALRASELGVRSAASIAAGYAVGACAMSNTMAARDVSRHTP